MRRIFKWDLESLRGRTCTQGKLLSMTIKDSAAHAREWHVCDTRVSKHELMVALTSQASQAKESGPVARQVALNWFPVPPPGHWQRRQSFGVPGERQHWLLNEKGGLGLSCTVRHKWVKNVEKQNEFSAICFTFTSERRKLNLVYLPKCFPWNIYPSAESL